ncbi:AAA family ATPase [Corallococcus exiguus]|uniref:AAA family ATPase n=1 Tax=Corallococcus exiguus TaxID=83462 RepID=UPI0014947470|nr:AAA family ATPase [Corallococcus exiguus]NPC69520.1 AAA family ATPase [Corallococcus exiguus]
MRLDRVVIRNYKSIKSIELRIPKKEARRQGSADFLSIVGENNAGKSSIMEAIRLACTAGMKANDEQFPQHDEARGPIEVELEFNQLTDKDRELAALAGHTYVEGGQERYRLKRTWEAPEVASKNSAFTPGRLPEHHLTGWVPAKKTLKSLKSLEQEDERWTPILERLAKDGVSKPTKNQLIEVARELHSPLLEIHQPSEWTPYPSGSTPALEAALPNVIYVPALRETNKETDVEAKTSSIRRIVNSLFEQHLSNHDRVVQFKKAAAELQDLFATEGKHRIVASMEEKLTEKFKELINISAELTFHAPDVTADLASSTQFRVLDAGLSTRPDHQGHGAQRSIVLALLQLYVEQSRQSLAREHHHLLFLIEEPEIYLHPGMCRRMRDTLLKIASGGIGQIICTTHSPVFLDLADRHDGIVILRKKEGHPVATQRIQDVFAQSEEDRARLRMLLNFDPAVNEAFFSEKVCLVEGDCEIAAVEAVARKLRDTGELDWPRYLQARRATTFINCRGKWTIPAFQKVLNAFRISYRVVYDRDQGSNADRANAQIEELLKGNGQSLVHEPNFEQFIFKETWADDKPWTVTRKIDGSSALNDRLLDFFTFALGQSLAQLKPAPAVASDTLLPLQRLQAPSRRNHRSRLKEYTVTHESFQSARKLDQLFRIAAGPNFAPRLGPDIPLQSIDGTKFDAFAIVTGESMADTLQHQDIVALRFLNGTTGIYLESVDSSESPSNASLPGVLENDGIYVLATNDYIDQRAYTMKRVKISTQPDGTWNCEIRADNPEAFWGHRGRFNILRTDRIHFLAQVVGLVHREAQEPTDPGSPELTVIPVAHDPEARVEDT